MVLCMYNKIARISDYNESNKINNRITIPWIVYIKNAFYTLHHLRGMWFIIFVRTYVTLRRT